MNKRRYLTLAVIIFNLVFVIITGAVSITEKFYVLGCVSLISLLLAVFYFYITGQQDKEYQLLYRTAYFDSLTGIPNRLSADLYVSRCGNPDNMAVAVADLDGLKAVNDTYGHFAGDILIRDFATAFFDAAAPYGFTARNGGDEFLALFYGPDHSRLIKEFSARLEEKVQISNRTAEYPVQYSIGFACGEDHECSTISELISYADRHMYCNKKAKKAQQSNPADTVCQTGDRKESNLP